MPIRFSLFLSTLLALPVVVQAQSIRPGDCAIIVASRETMPEAFAYIRDNAIDAAAIYASRNGWFAISVGDIANEGSGAFLTTLKARSAIPQDSFCSTGSAFTSLAWSRPVTVAPGTSADTASLDAPFDARPLTNMEKRYLQAGLTLMGTYTGLIDGDWGAGSQSAYEAFLRFEDWPDTNRSAAVLAVLTDGAFADGGWSPFFMPEINASLYVPGDLVTIADDPETGMAMIDSHDGAIATNFYVGDQSDVIDFHLFLRGHEQNWGPLYSSQSDGQIVTGSKNANLYWYVRSLRDPADGLWSTVSIINDLSDNTFHPAVMAAGFQIGRAPSLVAPDGGQLMSLIDRMTTEYEAERRAYVAATASPAPAPTVTAKPAPAAAAPSATDGERFTATGSGFYINAEAAIMTNAHVIANCDRLDVDGEAMRVVAKSDPFDLAIITPVTPRKTDAYLFFAEKPARLNSDITIAGFPLQGILSGLNISRGSISSVEGLDDATRMQISAPVQPGNSGGPIVDRYGRVVGIVVSRLDYDYTRQMSGADPQNINFGIRGAIGELFAGLQGVDITTTNTTPDIAPEDLADQLRDATVLINCEGTE